MAEINQTVSISENKLVNNQIDIVSLMMACEISPGGAAARRLIRLSAISVNGVQVTDNYQMITKEMLQNGIEICKGKKICIKVVLTA